MPKFLYHGTAADTLETIAEEGLWPSREPHWGGSLGEASVGRVYAAPSPEKAFYYSGILFREDLRNSGFSRIPVILRINASAYPWTKDEGDYFTEDQVGPSDIKVFWQGKWVSLEDGWNAIGPDAVYYKGEDDLEFRDWEGVEVGGYPRDALLDLEENYAEWGLLDQPVHALPEPPRGKKSPWEK